MLESYGDALAFGCMLAFAVRDVRSHARILAPYHEEMHPQVSLHFERLAGLLEGSMPDGQPTLGWCERVHS